MIAQNNKNVASSARTSDKKNQAKSLSARANEKTAPEATKAVRLSS